MLERSEILGARAIDNFDFCILDDSRVKEVEPNDGVGGDLSRSSRLPLSDDNEGVSMLVIVEVKELFREVMPVPLRGGRRAEGKAGSVDRSCC